MPALKLIFLGVFLVSINKFADAQLYSYSEPVCSTEQCRFLLQNLPTSGDPCDDFQQKLCYWRNDYDGNRLTHSDPEMTEFENVIEKKLTEKLVNRYTGDLRSIDQEKDLYQQCQKLGYPEGRNIDSERSWSSSKRFSEMVDLAKDIGIEEWKKVDQRLYELGFGYAFFDVKVVHDPKDTKKNVILLESPSVASLEATRKILFSHYRTIKNIFNAPNAKDFEIPMDKFFDLWIEAANKTMENSYMQFPNSRMTLEKWDDTFNNRYDEHYVLNINWVLLITQIFRQVNVTIDQFTPIIVKNERTYFEKLYYLLTDTPNDVIVAALLYKAATENLRYVDWTLVQLLNNAEKHAFCLNNIKHYGISNRLLHDFISKNEDHYKRLKYMVHSIIQSFQYHVGHSSLSFLNEAYLLDELERVTAGVFTNFDTEEYLNYISNYYGDFAISDNYFDSIVNYRKILKDKELSTLKSNSKNESKPFSVTDSRLPSNRFLLYICFMMHELSRSSLPENLPKEYYYGTYGTKIASFLYSLLSENKFENTEVNYAVEKSSKEILRTHPDYTREMLLCQHTSSVKKMEEYATEKVSEVFGVQIAYEAMKLDTSFKTDKNFEKITYPQNTEFIAKHYFFLSYAASHCRMYKEIVNSAVSIKDFVEIFNCRNETFHFAQYENECKIKMFNSFNNRALPIQL